MAIYRNIQMSFWTDTKIMEEFSIRDKLMYLYLLTNPHTNLCGCYEISIRQIAYETGLSMKDAKATIKRLQEEHNVISYSEETREVLLMNWSKYNWTASEKFRKPLKKEIDSVKDPAFACYLEAALKGTDTVSIPIGYGIDTTVTVTDTDTDTVTDTVADNKDDHSKKKTQKSMFDRLIADRAVSHDMEEALREWIAYKAERNERYKEAGMRSLITQAVNHGAANGSAAVCNVIRESMASGYKGIVWDRIGKSPPGRKAKPPERDYEMDALELKLLASN